jgi:hypothetical protein
MFFALHNKGDWTFFAPPPSATLTNTMNSNFDNAVLRASLEAAIDDSLEAEIIDSLEVAIGVRRSMRSHLRTSCRSRIKN